jgi:hypothetical protein
MEHQCKQCGAEFHAKAGRLALYCSNTCRQAAHRGTPAGKKWVRILQPISGQPTAVREPDALSNITDNDGQRVAELEEEIKWQENEIARLRHANEKLRLGMPPTDADPVASVWAAWNRLSNGERVRFCEGMRARPEMTTAIALRHGRLLKGEKALMEGKRRQK